MVEERNENRIVRRWIDLDAPTGEGERWKTADGRVWHRPLYPSMCGTGDSRGVQVGDAIYDTHP